MTPLATAPCAGVDCTTKLPPAPPRLCARPHATTTVTPAPSLTRVQELVVPRRRTGVIIGPGGETASNIRRITRCQLHVRKDVRPDDTQLVEVSGSIGQVGMRGEGRGGARDLHCRSRLCVCVRGGSNGVACPWYTSKEQACQTHRIGMLLLAPPLSHPRCWSFRL